MTRKAASTIVTSLIAGSMAIAAAIAPAALQANTAAPHFTAELAEAANEDQVIAGGVVFRCEGTICTGPRSRDRDLRVCSELRREVGTIVRFSAGGEELAASRLSRCNG